MVNIFCQVCVISRVFKNQVFIRSIGTSLHQHKPRLPAIVPSTRDVGGLLHQHKPCPLIRIDKPLPHLPLRLPKRLRDRHFPLQPVLVKGGHEHRSLLIRHLPQRHDKVLRPGDLESPLQAVHAFVALDVAQTRLSVLRCHLRGTRR